MKKIISIVLCIIMLVATLGAVPASAKVVFVDHNSFYEEVDDYDICYSVIDGVYYSAIDDCCLTSGTVVAILPPKGTKKVEIPDEVSICGEVVEITSIYIESRYNRQNTEVEEIVIGDNIESITGVNFLPNLKKITLGNSVCNIKNSFNGCKNLETFEANSNFIVEDGALYRCSKNIKMLVSVFDDTITSFEVKSGTTHFISPFGSIPNVTVKNLTINENLETLQTGKLKKLKTITFGEDVNKIKNIDLLGVRNLKTLDLSNIKVNKFSATGVWHLKSVTFGKVGKLLKRSFSGCKKIERIEFKEEIPRIYRDAFKNKKSGIKFYVKNKKAAKSLKAELKNSGAKKPKIYIGKKLYK